MKLKEANEKGKERVEHHSEGGKNSAIQKRRWLKQSCLTHCTTSSLTTVTLNAFLGIILKLKECIIGKMAQK